jgi:uncharacterized lipoprotein YajG
MKKLFVLFACVALLAACNSGTTETEVTSTEETASTEIVDVSTDTIEATATK